MWRLISIPLFQHAITAMHMPQTVIPRQQTAATTETAIIIDSDNDGVGDGVGDGDGDGDGDTAVMGPIKKT